MKSNLETMLQEVETIASAMQRGDLSLDDSIKSYEKAMKILVQCRKQILSAEKSIKILQESLTGELKEVDFTEHTREDGSESTQDWIQPEK